MPYFEPRRSMPGRTIRSTLCAAVLAALATPAFAHGDEDDGKKFELSGLLEVEAGYLDSSDGTDSSDITAATVELHLDAEINERVSTHVQLLWEENDTDPLDMDEATITLKLTDDWFLTAGKRYIPFGRFDSAMISDPLTLELAETQESVIQLGFERDGLAGSAYVFKSKTDEDGDPTDDRHIGSFGADLGYALETDNGGFDLSVSYVSNLGDSNSLRGLFEDSGTGLDSQVPGAGFFASYSFGPFTVLAEHIMALDEFTAGDYALLAGGEEPSATNFEAQYEMPNGLMLAAAYQRTDDLEFLLPEHEKGFLVTISKEIIEGASLGIEYASFDHYDGGDHQQVTVQLAAEF